MDMQKYLTIKVKNCYDYNPVGKLFEVFEKGRGKLKSKNKIMFDEEPKEEETTPETPEEEPEGEEEDKEEEETE